MQASLRWSYLPGPEENDVSHIKKKGNKRSTVVSGDR